MPQKILNLQVLQHVFRKFRGNTQKVRTSPKFVHEKYFRHREPTVLSIMIG